MVLQIFTKLWYLHIDFTCCERLSNTLAKTPVSKLSRRWDETEAATSKRELAEKLQGFPGIKLGRAIWGLRIGTLDGMEVEQTQLLC